MSKLPTTIYAESTPNPNTMKFVANRLLIENNMTVEYTSPEQSKDSPLAERVFNFPFVTGIFISSNFITVTKNDLCDWDDVVLEVREYIQNYLTEGKALFNTPVEDSEHAFTGSLHDNFEAASASNDIEQKIIDVLEEYIRPAVENDGGAIHFKSLEDKKVTVVMRGACSGCPSSTVTLKNGIETLLKQMIPGEVEEVVAEEL